MAYSKFLSSRLGRETLLWFYFPCISYQRINYIMMSTRIIIMLKEDGKPKKLLLDRIRIEVKLSAETTKKQQLFLIYSVLKANNECIEVTVRKILQVQHLVQDMYQKYGGFVIPILDLNNSFRFKQSLDYSLKAIGEYLNDLVRNVHCQRDEKLYEFLFQQEVHFPNIERYDKILSDAAVLSRRYLNSIFTRKDTQTEQQPEFTDLFMTFQALKKMSANFKDLQEIIELTALQQETVEEIVAAFSDIHGKLGMGVQPIQFLTPNQRKRITRFNKFIYQAHEAYYRWEVLSQTVKELQCNLYKGLHQDNGYYQSKAKQLRIWAKTLRADIQQIITKGQTLMIQLSKDLYSKKREEGLSHEQFTRQQNEKQIIQSELQQQAKKKQEQQ